MFWKKKSKSELQKRVDELEVDKKNYMGLVQYQSDQLMRQSENWKRTQKELNRKKEEIHKWNKLGRFISSVEFKSDKNQIQDRGIELISVLDQSLKDFISSGHVLSKSVESMCESRENLETMDDGLLSFKTQLEYLKSKHGIIK